VKEIRVVDLDYKALQLAEVPTTGREIDATTIAAADFVFM